MMSSVILRYFKHVFAFSEWAVADKVLYYTTFDHLKRANKVWRHLVGSDPSVDQLIFREKDARYCSHNLIFPFLII